MDITLTSNLPPLSISLRPISGGVSLDLVDSPVPLKASILEVAKGDVGPVGPVGPIGPLGNRIPVVCAYPINSYKLIKITNDRCEYASSNNISDINKVSGMSLMSGTTDGEIHVQLFGEVENTGWNFIPNQDLYLGIDGEITPNLTGLFVNHVGYAITPTKIFLKIGRSIRN